MNVSEFKQLVKDWPEYHADGEPTEVWVETGEGLSGPLNRVEYLNCRPGPGGEDWTADMLLCPRPEAWQS